MQPSAGPTHPHSLIATYQLLSLLCGALLCSALPLDDLWALWTHLVGIKIRTVFLGPHGRQGQDKAATFLMIVSGRADLVCPTSLGSLPNVRLWGNINLLT